MKALLLVMCSLIPHFTLAGEAALSDNSDKNAGLPFAPAHAADQKVITSIGLQEEFEEFRAISQWQTAQSQYQAAELKYAQARHEFMRAQSLRAGGTMTETAYAAIYYNLRSLEGDMIRLPTEIQQARMTGLFHKFRVLEEGNPGTEFRKTLTQIMIDGLKLQLVSLDSSIAVATEARELAQTYYQHGQTLSTRKVLAPADLERRALSAKNAAVQLQGLENQKSVVQSALASFAKSFEQLK